MRETSLIKKRFRFKHDWWGYIFIAPFFIVFAIFQLYPMIMSFFYAFTDFNIDSYTYSGGNRTVEFDFVGIQKFQELMNMPRFWQSLLNTAIIWIINFIPQIVLALLFAAIFTSTRYKMRGSGAFKVIYFLPNILTATSIALLFRLLFEYQAGPMDKVFRNLNIFKSDPDYVLFSDAIGTRLLISFIQFWRYFGHSLIILAAGMLGINPTLYEAAEVDGASKIKQFFSITLPSLKPILLFSLVTSLIGGLQMFDIPFLMNDGGPTMAGGRFGSETIAVFIYKFSFGDRTAGDYALSSAASVILFFISLICTAILFWIMGDKKEKNFKVKREVE